MSLLCHLLTLPERQGVPQEEKSSDAGSLERTYTFLSRSPPEVVVPQRGVYQSLLSCCEGSIKANLLDKSSSSLEEVDVIAADDREMVVPAPHVLEDESSINLLTYSCG